MLVGVDSQALCNGSFPLLGLVSPSFIGAKPNIYCEAIELVCGGSPKACVLVEWKALDREKSEL